MHYVHVHIIMANIQATLTTLVEYWPVCSQRSPCGDRCRLFAGCTVLISNRHANSTQAAAGGWKCDSDDKIKTVTGAHSWQHWYVLTGLLHGCLLATAIFFSGLWLFEDLCFCLPVTPQWGTEKVILLWLEVLECMEAGQTVLSSRVCSKATHNTQVHKCTCRVWHAANNSVTSDPSPLSPLSLVRTSAGQYFCLNSISPAGTLLKLNIYWCLWFSEVMF